MNLSPDWVQILKTSGWETLHWSEIGNPRAKIQIRTQDVTPRVIAPFFIQILRTFEKMLEEGALVVIDGARARARILPFSGS